MYVPVFLGLVCSMDVAMILEISLVLETHFKSLATPLSNGQTFKTRACAERENIQNNAHLTRKRGFQKKVKGEFGVFL